MNKTILHRNVPIYPYPTFKIFSLGRELSVVGSSWRKKEKNDRNEGFNMYSTFLLPTKGNKYLEIEMGKRELGQKNYLNDIVKQNNYLKV